jgi:site-specific recombinase XerD
VVEKFLTHLTVERNVAASTQNQALNAIVFLYKEVWGQDPGWLKDMERAQRPARVPVVLTTTEVRSLLARLEGRYCG